MGSPAPAAPAASASGSAPFASADTLRSRKPKSADSGSPAEVTERHSKESKESKPESASPAWERFERVAAPLFFTLAAVFTRLYRIGRADHVVWDEAHFGKFGSYYLRHEFYHDVHPPLGKMLIGLSGYIAGYNGSYDFDSGSLYPEHVKFVQMRIFNSLFSIACVPMAYYTARALRFSTPATWLFALMVLCENSYVTLGKFILLDSMLLCFVVSTYLCMVKFHQQRRQPFSPRWWLWLFLSGVSMGCVVSVKMVGLFVISVYGLYTVVDLWQMLGDKRMSWRSYVAHWVARATCLIAVPMAVFMLAFKVHFMLLWHSGTGDANMNSLFQANLVGSQVLGGPRDLAFGSVATLKNQGFGSGLLHSHVQTYPEGSKQQQVTTYAHKDNNNNWLVDYPRVRGQEQKSYSEELPLDFLVDGATIRLVHPSTGRNLHTHPVPAPITKREYEVSGYGNVTIGDEKDNWILEIVDQLGNENATRLHPLTTSFRLRHPVMDCYLATTGQSLPHWGFRQGEVTCRKNPFRRDKTTWWNIEFHANDRLEDPGQVELPKTRFLSDFIQLNFAMMASNNALVPDPDKQDDLASQAWQWPTLNVGIRICSWADESVKYFLLGSPANTWGSSVGLITAIVLFVALLIRYQRQYNDFPGDGEAEMFLLQGFYPFVGWMTHFLPFLIMGRVLYVHHYLPALYFAMLVFVFQIDYFTRARGPRPLWKKLVVAAVYIACYTGVVYIFYLFAPISFGMEGDHTKYEYLNWLKTWRI